MTEKKKFQLNTKKDDLKGSTIITGFPGFGLVGTITTEFLLNHLECKHIGGYISEKLAPVAAVHNKELVSPVGLFYNKEYHMVILHVVTDVKGLEWELSQLILDLAHDIDAKEVISLEGVAKQKEEADEQLYFYTTDAAAQKKLEGFSFKHLDEGIIFGTTACIMINAMHHTKPALTTLFCEATMKYPDSKAAAKVIEALDHYLSLNVDYKPLLERAKVFEDKLKGILEKSKEAVDKSEDRTLNYLG